MAAEQRMNDVETGSRAIEAAVTGDDGRFASAGLTLGSHRDDASRAQKVEVPLEGLGIVLSIPMELFGKHATLERALRPKEVVRRSGTASTPPNSGVCMSHRTHFADACSHSFASDPDIEGDPIVQHLLRAGREAQELDKDIGPIYADAVRLALVAKLLGNTENGKPPCNASTQKAPLPEWRLKRTLEYIDANYARTITLGDLAAVAGLSRMHFAAQFRQATGCRPREFVLRRRTGAAQKMLLETRAPLVEIALNVGFQTQAHFSTVFKRFTGETPNRWRSARFSGTVRG